MTDPFSLFDAWMAEAAATEPNDANAMALATVDETGLPNVRIVLLKDVSAGGFVFYTNSLSTKGRELAASPGAALNFHWKVLRRQVRLRGAVAPVTGAEADAYFATRPRQSQIGAWASRQSRALASHAELEACVAAAEQRFAAGDVPRPPHWHGYRLVPATLEFWQEQPFRLHTRRVFTRQDGGWSQALAYP